eukprot:3551415-Amphidinium_carterae.1
MLSEVPSPIMPISTRVNLIQQCTWLERYVGEALKVAQSLRMCADGGAHASMCLTGSQTGPSEPKEPNARKRDKK